MNRRRTATSKTSTRISTTTSEGLIALGLGSNVGDRKAALRWAVGELRRLLGALEIAPLYRTAPVSPIPQDDFFNTVVLAGLAGAPQPREVLARAKGLERAAGRRPGPRFGPRPLDVDLLLYGDRVLAGDPRSGDPRSGVPRSGVPEDELILPHPRMRRRRFVLAPLHDLRPALRLPPDGAAVRDLLAALGVEQPVERIDW